MKKLLITLFGVYVAVSFYGEFRTGLHTIKSDVGECYKYLMDEEPPISEDIVIACACVDGPECKCGRNKNGSLDDDKS